MAQIIFSTPSSPFTRKLQCTSLAIQWLSQYIQGGSFFNGQFARISKDPSGVPHQEWINTIPNDGLIYYMSLLNQERLLVTSPQALSEVLTQKSYEFIKPAMLRNGLGRVLGVGLLLAEGDEHKVWRFISFSWRTLTILPRHSEKISCLPLPTAILKICILCFGQSRASWSML